MRIGIDATVFKGSTYTGVSRCAYEIIRNWIKRYPEHEYFLFSGTTILPQLILPDNWHRVVKPCVVGGAQVWNIIELPKLIKQNKIDAFWGPNFILPKKNGNIKYYVTVHDLAPFKIRGIAATSNSLKLKLFAKRSCLRADKVIAVSKATQKDVIDIFKIPEKKVIVSYNGGLPTEFTSDCLVKKVCKLEKEKYFLFVSTIEPRKNLITLIKAFEKYLENTNSNIKLVLVGKKGWKCKSIFNAIENSPYKEQIILPGYVSDEEKAWLYQNAVGFIFPSLYEGFGIPILEAMAYGVITITAKNSSLCEVGGDAVLYMQNEKDTEELSQLMNKVVSMKKEEKTIFRKKMEKQVRKFSWDKNADEIMKLIMQN